MSPKKPFKVDYQPSDFLGGTMLLDAMEELAYRRICDLIYVTDDNLPDDPKLASLTKTGKRWPAIRERLLELGKIEVINSRITQRRCRDELALAKGRISRAQFAGTVSAEKRKTRKTKKTRSTTVERELNGRSTDAEFELAPSTNQPPATSHQPLLDLSKDKSVDAHFDQWWTLYPKKDGRADALHWYRRALKLKGVTPELLLDRMTAWAATQAQTETQYITAGWRWLKGKRWEDGGQIATAAPAPDPERDAKVKAYLAACDKAYRECVSTTDPRYPKRSDFGLEDRMRPNSAAYAAQAKAQTAEKVG